MQQKNIFFFTDTATTEIYTLSLHDALPISKLASLDLARLKYGPETARRFLPAIRNQAISPLVCCRLRVAPARSVRQDRKSTRLNSSHGYISYAVFCLKKKTYEAHARYGMTS